CIAILPSGTVVTQSAQRPSRPWSPQGAGCLHWLSTRRQFPWCVAQLCSSSKAQEPTQPTADWLTSHGPPPYTQRWSAPSSRAPGGLHACRPVITILYAKAVPQRTRRDRKSTRLNSSHVAISYAVFCLKKKKKDN